MIVNFTVLEDIESNIGLFGLSALLQLLQKLIIVVPIHSN